MYGILYDYLNGLWLRLSSCVFNFGGSKIEVVNESEERFFSTTAIIYYVISITNFTMIVMEWNM